MRTKLRLETLALAVAQNSRFVHVHKPARNAAEQPVAARSERVAGERRTRVAPHKRGRHNMRLVLWSAEHE
jgi:hypothetical protein